MTAQTGWYVFRPAPGAKKQQEKILSDSIFLANVSLEVLNIIFLYGILSFYIKV